MLCRARITLPEIPLHIIQRGNKRQACFRADDDYRFYLKWLEEYAGKCGCSIHAYVLMTNHVHLLLTPTTAEASGALMKWLGQRYVQYCNRTYRRSGTLWKGRFRSCLAQDDNYVLSCYRYIELNPVRANMVEHPAEYRWSSFRANGQDERDSLLTPHPLYEALGPTEAQRRANYRELFRFELDPGMIDEIRSATNGDFALGDERFRRQVESALGRRASPGRSGRPRKSDPESTPSLRDSEKGITG